MDRTVEEKSRTSKRPEIKWRGAYRMTAAIIVVSIFFGGCSFFKTGAGPAPVSSPLPATATSRRATPSPVEDTPTPSAPVQQPAIPATQEPATPSPAPVSPITSSQTTLPEGWPMAGANPQRTSWAPEEVPGALKPLWFKRFDAYISQKVQIVAANNALFIATSQGLVALDAATGSQRWSFPTSLPLGHSPTIADGVVYVGGFDKMIHALDAQSGSELWSFQAGAGFETNPLVVEGMLFAGNRDGVFYALYTQGPRAGQLAWSFPTGGPILFSAAYADGVVYFASNDNYAYALRTADGSLVWKSAKLPGHGFHSYWPVVYRDLVIFPGSYNYRYTPPFPAPHTTLETQGAYPPGSSKGDPIGPRGAEPGDWIAGTQTLQDTGAAQYFEQFPHRRTYFVLRRSNGQEFTFDSDGDGQAEYAPILWFGTHSGTRFPPIVAADGVLYQSNNLFYDRFIPRGEISGWKVGTPFVSLPPGPGNAVDEPMAYSAGGNMIYYKRCCDRMAGGFQVTASSGTAEDLQSWNYFDEGGRTLRRSLPELFAEGWDFAYWKHGDQSPPIPYQGKVFLIANNAVVAFSKDGSGPVLTDMDPGSLSGEAPADIEREQTFSGLTTKVTLGVTAWPMMIQQETYYNTDGNPKARARWFRLVEVSAGGTAAAGLSVEDKGASTLLTQALGSGQTLQTWVSRRSPATRFETRDRQYNLRAAFSGVAYPTAGGVRVASGDASIDGKALSEGWLLAWDSSQQHRWSPVVFTLQRRPERVDLSAEGLALSFPGAAGYLAVTPLYGMSSPRSQEAEAWKHGLSAETVQRVQLLDRVARAFPETAQEDFSVDNATGDATLAYTYTFLEGENDFVTVPLRLAYLPPALALAAWNGSPIQVNGRPLEQQLDLDYVTPLGRATGAPDSDTVTIRLPGIAKTWQAVLPLPLPPAQDDPIAARLVAEIQKMLDAGPLLPGYGMVGLWEVKADSRLGDNLVDYWKNPADTVYTLLRALPLLPEVMHQPVREYVRREIESYPLESTAHTGWREGANRYAFDLPPEALAEGQTTGPAAKTAFDNWGLPPQNLYALWMAAEEFGGAPDLFARAKDHIDHSPAFLTSFPYTLNSAIAGHIGFLRLAALAQAGPQPEAERALVGMLVLRAALSKYPQALAQAGFEYGGYAWTLRKFSPNQPDTLFNATVDGSLWSQMRLYGIPVDRIYGLSGASAGGDYAFAIDFVNLTPELASFLRRFARRETQEMVASYTSRAPYWFVAEAEETGGEGVLQPLYDRVAFFQAKAMALQESRGALEPFLDVPAVAVGDLFFIQNLISILEAPAQ